MKKLLIVLSVGAFCFASVSCTKKCTCQEWIHGVKEGKEHKEKTLTITHCQDIGDFVFDEDGKKHGIQCK